MHNGIVKQWTKSAAIMTALVIWILVYSHEALPANAQTLPSLVGLAGLVPADASSVGIDVFILNGQPHASVGYTRNEPIRLPFTGMTRELAREYMDVYRWDGSSWRKVLDGYPFAAGLYGSRIVGPLDAGRPTPRTALVSFRATPLPQPSADPRSMPDLLAIELHYLLGPTGVEHPAPTLAVLLPTAEGFTTVYTTDFNARASIESIYRLDDSLVVRVPAYVSGLACCPDGTEHLRLVWRDGQLVEAERRIRPGRAASLTSCTGR